MIQTLLKKRFTGKKGNKKGFTLVELIVVLVIIAILAAVLIPTMTGYISRTRKTAAQSDTETMVTAAKSAITDCIGDDKTLSADTTFTGSSGTIANGDNTNGGAFYTEFSTKISDYNQKAKFADFSTAGINSVTISADGALKELIYTTGNYTVKYTEAEGKYVVYKKADGADKLTDANKA